MPEEEAPLARPASAQGQSAGGDDLAGMDLDEEGDGSAGGYGKRRKVGAQKRLHEDTRFGEETSGGLCCAMDGGCAVLPCLPWAGWSPHNCAAWSGLQRLEASAQSCAEGGVPAVLLKACTL